jgi:hypothetical protein
MEDSTMTNRCSKYGYPDNWWDAIGVRRPQQPTQDEVSMAQKELIDDIPTFCQFVADIKKNIDTLCEDNELLTPEQRRQVNRYKKVIYSLHTDAQQLMEMMRQDFENAENTEAQDSETKEEDPS